MSQLLNLAQIFTAAGGTAHPAGKGIYLLYVEPSEDEETNALLSKLWTGDEFGDEQDLISSSVHPNSPAAYLLSPNGKSVVYFSSSSILSISTYDDDEGAWNEEDGIPEHQAHPNSKIAATYGTDGRRRVFFQDPSQRLIYVDEKWNATKLDVNIQEGSPFAISIPEGQLRLYYLGKDNNLHYTTQRQDGKWIDAIFSTYTFEEKLKRILVMPNDGKLEVFAFTEGKEMLRVTEEGKKTVLGSVDEAGKFIASTKEEAGFFFYFSFFYSYW